MSTQMDLLCDDAQDDALELSAPKNPELPLMPPASVKKPTASAAAPDALVGEEKAPCAFKTISEVASFLSVPQHVLRFWESRFSQIKPLKLRGGRRYYRPEDIETLTTIKNLLYKQGYTIKGAKKAFVHAPEQEPQAVVPAKPKTVGEKQLNQLTVIRQELIGMRDVLKAFID